MFEQRSGRLISHLGHAEQNIFLTLVVVRLIVLLKYEDSSEDTASDLGTLPAGTSYPRNS